MTFSEEGFVTSVFYLIVVPLKGYNDPENLPDKVATGLYLQSVNASLRSPFRSL